jgi:hypothetical protein
VVAPWSGFWEHNRFAHARPGLEAFLNSPYSRGAVTGVGVITAMAGLAELGSLVLSKGRRRDHPPSPLENQ